MNTESQRIADRQAFPVSVVLHTLREVIPSAVVRMELRVNGHVVPISQMGPNFLVIGQPFEHPPANAEVSLRIDDAEKRWGVLLVEGISATRRKTMVAGLPKVNGEMMN
jgi:hypothetical protein